MKILFQGDSITDAFRKPDEINPAFQLGNGYAFLVASHLGAYHPERQFEFFNRGVGGNRVQDLAERWEKDAVELNPDLLSLLVGVNAVICRQKGRTDLSNEEFLACYRTLLNQLLVKNPKIRFILLEPFLLEAGDVNAAWKADLKPIQEGIALIAKDYGAPLVPLQGVLDEGLKHAPAAYWTYDGIHASHAGFRLIADAWLKAAEEAQLLR